MGAGKSLSVTCVDYHTAGEPFRIVSGGVPPLRGKTILDRRSFAAEHLDDFRRLLVQEPRGHADMYGCFVTEPEDDGADLGVVFFHNAGYSTACGHGTIALATWAIDSGLVAADGDEAEVVVDVPSGRVRTISTMADGRVRSVRFRNVPAFVQGNPMSVETSAGPVTAEVSYGGAYYASVPASEVGLVVEPASVNAFIALGRQIKDILNENEAAIHPEDPRLSGIYGVMFFEDVADASVPLRQRSITVFADGEVDRSPCGSGTSARLALLHRDGRLRTGETMVHESIIRSQFAASVVEETETYGQPAVVTEIEGAAHRTGYHQFVLEPDDDVGTGFLLR
ncbi:MAG: proline racemase family protein [Actinomycetota bacterium]